MLKYCGRQSSGTLSATPQALARRVPAMPVKSSKFKKSSCSKAMSHFQLDNHIIDDLLNIDASPHQGTVQEEYDKYTAASLSPLEMDILHFWEVSYTHINKDKRCSLEQYRSTRQSSQHCSESPWIIFQFKHLLFPVNECSHPPRKLTLSNTTASTQC